MKGTITMEETNTLAQRLYFLAWATALSSLAYLARVLSSEKRPLKPLQVFGGILGSAIAAFSFCAIAIEFFDISNLLILALAGPVGWVGGDALAAIAGSVGKRYGVDLEDKK